METNSATFPSQPTAFTHAPHRSGLKNWQSGVIGASRVAFGLVWAVAAWLKWQPDFQNHFLDQVSAAKDGQPSLVEGWISFWMHFDQYQSSALCSCRG